MAVEALRARIGDAAFFSLLLQWTQQKRGGTATIEQFQVLAEQVSGQDLAGFFRAWLVDDVGRRRQPERTLSSRLTRLLRSSPDTLRGQFAKAAETWALRSPVTRVARKGHVPVVAV